MGMLVSSVLHDLMVEGPKWSGLVLDYNQAKLPISRRRFSRIQVTYYGMSSWDEKKQKKNGQYPYPEPYM